MKQKHVPYRNLWSLTVLCFLRERPMHPYEMQRLIRQRHKDEFLDLKPGSLYHAIDRLQRANLIEPVETSRDGKRPERTVYRLTELGEREVLDWLRELLAQPVREKSQFLAAMSHVAHLPPEDARDQLKERANRLEVAIVALNAVLQSLSARLPRVVLVEAEYARASCWLCWRIGTWRLRRSKVRARTNRRRRTTVLKRLHRCRKNGKKPSTT